MADGHFNFSNEEIRIVTPNIFKTKERKTSYVLSAAQFENENFMKQNITFRIPALAFKITDRGDV